MSSLSVSIPGVFDGVRECSLVSNYEHRLFLTTNEADQDVSLEKLARHETVGDTIMGVSCFFTLNIASCRGLTSRDSRARIKHIVMLDRSAALKDFWGHAIEIIKSSADRVEVKDKIVVLVKERCRFYGYESCESCLSSWAEREIRDFQSEIDRGDSWLSSDIRFARIKQIFDESHFVFKSVDWFDGEAVIDIVERMKRCGMVLDTLYTSNLNEYAESEDRLREFQRSIDPLLSRDVFLISTKIREGGIYSGARLTQRVNRRRGAAIKACFPRSPESKFSVLRLKKPEKSVRTPRVFKALEGEFRGGKTVLLLEAFSRVFL